MANQTINQVTVEEFKKHFCIAPISYKSTNGTEYITFITTQEIFSQLFMSTEVPTFNKILYSTDRSGNKCGMCFKEYHNSDNGFKMIVAIHNKVTNERIALIAA